MAHSSLPLAALRLQATPERLVGLALRPPLLEISLQLRAAQAALGLAQLTVVAAALLVLFMEQVGPAEPQEPSLKVVAVGAALVPMGLVAALHQILGLAAEAGLVFREGLEITVLAAGAGAGL